MFSIQALQYPFQQHHSTSTLGEKTKDNSISFPENNNSIIDKTGEVVEFKGEDNSQFSPLSKNITENFTQKPAQPFPLSNSVDPPERRRSEPNANRFTVSHLPFNTRKNSVRHIYFRRF